MIRSFFGCLAAVLAIAVLGVANEQPEVPIVTSVDGQPVAAGALRLLQGLEYLGTALPDETATELRDAARERDSQRLQQLLDPHVLFVVSLNPEVRVRVQRGPAQAKLFQAGFTPVIVKVINDSTVAGRLNIYSPQAGAVYSGAALLSLKRQAQTELNNNQNVEQATDRFLNVEMFRSAPMTANLSGLRLEYSIALIFSSESGQREATIGFDVGSGTQDIGFRGEVPVLFDVRPAVPVNLSIRDHDGNPTAARLVFRDARGHVYPSQVKRLAPDFFFQPQIYRADGDTVSLPLGTFDVEYCRGPEYRVQHKKLVVAKNAQTTLEIRLDRWIDPMEFGYYCGDHHIHGAGCSHYENPTQGVTPQDMFRQVKGEGLNVGCVLTWGPCFEFQRNFFAPDAADISEPLTVLKYDLEISGFGSAALGHVCLLNLRDQTFPGSDGTKEKGWPTWTVPVLRWAKEQGGVTGYPHSAFAVNVDSAAKRLIDQLDSDDDGDISQTEAMAGLLPDTFDTIDEDRNRFLSNNELRQSVEKVSHQLPNLAIPDMGGPGALEICVAVAEGVCDFVSAMDTPRVSEWNTWYHLLNCGFPLKVSGETDFPCMSSRRVGQGRVYVRLGHRDRVDFVEWCRGLAAGRSYVSDGFAHAVEFSVNGAAPGGGSVALDKPGMVEVTARVAFAESIPRGVAYGTIEPAGGRRVVGDTVLLHAPRSDESHVGGNRLVEIVVNGQASDSIEVPADGKIHDLKFTVPIQQSSWIALRQFPQLHTNPVDVLIGVKPIRASRESALWCAESVKQLWEKRHTLISESERAAADKAYQRAIALYERIASEATKPDVKTSARDLIRPHFEPPTEFANDLGNYRSPLQFADGNEVAKADDWPRRRAEILKQWNELMGPWPPVVKNPKLGVISQSRRENFTQKRVRLEIAPNQTGEGWLLLPDGDGRRPAVLVVYYEPETSVGLKPEQAHRDFALQLTRRGFVTLSIGTPGGDARKPQLGQAVCQPLSFHAYVAANCWQTLANLPEVDSSRIGVTGHSYGGKWAMFAAALWDQFAAVAVSDPGIVFDETRANVNYWEPWYLGLDSQIQRPNAGVPSADNPRTGAYKLMIEQGRDLHELHALIAPRPFLVSGGSEDPPERWRALNHLVRVNKTLGFENRVAMTNRPDHSPNEESNARLVAFFEHFLLDSSAADR